MSGLSLAIRRKSQNVISRHSSGVTAVTVARANALADQRELTEVLAGAEPARPPGRRRRPTPRRR